MYIFYFHDILQVLLSQWQHFEPVAGIYVCTYICMYLYMYFCVRMHACIVYACTRACVCSYVWMSVCKCTYVCVYVCLCGFMYVCTIFFFFFELKNPDNLDSSASQATWTLISKHYKIIANIQFHTIRCAPCLLNLTRCSCTEADCLGTKRRREKPPCETKSLPATIYRLIHHYAHITVHKDLYRSTHIPTCFGGGHHYHHQGRQYHRPKKNRY